MTHNIVLIPGDGIGPEIADATQKVLDAAGVRIDWERVECSEKIIRETGLARRRIDEIHAASGRAARL